MAKGYNPKYKSREHQAAVLINLKQYFEKNPRRRAVVKLLSDSIAAHQKAGTLKQHLKFKMKQDRSTYAAGGHYGGLYVPFTSLGFPANARPRDVKGYFDESATDDFPGYVRLGWLNLDDDVDETRENPSTRYRRRRFLRSHSGLNTELRSKRLGSAMYILGLRYAKQQGYAGIFSMNPRSNAAREMWKRIRTGHTSSSAPFNFYPQEEPVFPVAYDWDYLTSVRPHARRVGQVKREQRLRRARRRA